MRINKYIAQNTGLSRRTADQMIVGSKVLLNGRVAVVGDTVHDGDTVTLNGTKISRKSNYSTILLHKPIGYVCSRDGQGSDTIYALLPEDLHRLKPVGRLDKNSSGLLLMTDDGDLAHSLTHPKFKKEKVYEVTIDRPLTDAEMKTIREGVDIGDQRPSKLKITLSGAATYRVVLAEGRNRQIRRTFDVLNRKVIKLHRLKFGEHSLGRLPEGMYEVLN